VSSNGRWPPFPALTITEPILKPSLALLPEVYATSGLGRNRRRKPTNPLSFSSLFGSRREFRRRKDVQRYEYVDQYSIRISFLVIYVVLLSVWDTLLTLKILNQGGQELHPLMDTLLGYG